MGVCTGVFSKETAPVSCYSFGVQCPVLTRDLPSPGRAHCSRTGGSGWFPSLFRGHLPPEMRGVGSSAEVEIGFVWCGFVRCVWRESVVVCWEKVLMCCVGDAADEMVALVLKVLKDLSNLDEVLQAFGMSGA